MQIQPLLEGQYFHIYNRGVNGENLFKERKNYLFFLKQYVLYCSEVLETLAYCLLKNHFHLVCYVRENIEVPKKNGDGMFRLTASKQLSHFFNSYAQSFNKMYDRTGPLFESPFERKLIDNPAYLPSVICYCNLNPQLHGFVDDFRNWEFSSYAAIIQNETKFISSQKVIDMFGGVAGFKEAHNLALRKDDFEKCQMEYKPRQRLQTLTAVCPGENQTW